MARTITSSSSESDKEKLVLVLSIRLFFGRVPSTDNFFFWDSSSSTAVINDAIKNKILFWKLEFWLTLRSEYHHFLVFWIREFQSGLGLISKTFLTTSLFWPFYLAISDCTLKGSSRFRILNFWKTKLISITNLIHRNMKL